MEIHSLPRLRTRLEQLTQLIRQYTNEIAKGGKENDVINHLIGKAGSQQRNKIGKSLRKQFFKLLVKIKDSNKESNKEQPINKPLKENLHKSINWKLVLKIRNAQAKNEGVVVGKQNSNSKKPLSDNAKLALKTFKEIVPYLYPYNFPSIIEAAGKLEKLFSISELDFYKVVEKKYDRLSYTESEFQAARKSTYGMMLLTRNKDFPVTYIHPPDINVGVAMDLLSPLNMIERRTLLSAIFFDPEADIRLLDNFMESLSEIINDKEEDTRPEILPVTYIESGIETSNITCVSDGIECDQEAKKELSKERNELGKDLEFIGRILYTHITNHIKKRHKEYDDIEFDYGLGYSGNIGLKNINYEIRDERIDYEAAKINILLEGWRKSLFDLSFSDLVNLFHLAPDRESRQFSMHAFALYPGINDEEKKFIRNLLLEEVKNPIRGYDDFGWRRHDALLAFAYHTKGEERNNIIDIEEDEDPLVKLAVFRILTDPNLGGNEESEALLIKHIEETANKENGAYLLALLIRRADIKMNPPEDEDTIPINYESILEKVLSSEKINFIDAIERFNGMHFEHPVQDSDEIFVEPYSISEFNKYLTINQLFKWILEGNNTTLKENAGKILLDNRLFSSEDFQKFIAVNEKAAQVLEFAGIQSASQQI